MGILSRSSIAVGAAVCSLLFLGNPAQAHETPNPPNPGGKHPVIVSDSGWQPSESTVGNIYHPSTCGTTIDVEILVDEVQTREIEFANGDVKIYYKGDYVNRLTAPTTGRSVRLDNSGKYTEVDYASGALYFNVFGPAVVPPFSQGEADAFKKAGLPPVFSYRDGRFEEYIVDDVTYISRQPKKVTNVCRLLGLPDDYTYTG